MSTASHGAQRAPTHGTHQRGAALLLAMLVVALVATLSSAALWQQWRAVEIESAERHRLQASWVLNGAFDWARLILREDARGNRTGAVDHLGEPWATPLEEAQLSSFLAADQDNNSADNRDDLLPAYLSGQLQDAQARLNFRNLVRRTGSGAEAKTELSPPDLASFVKLYQQLGLPGTELTQAADRLLETEQRASDDPRPSPTPLAPQRFAHLAWLGVSASSLQALAPHATVLPERTPLNLNTASAEALSAAIPDLDLAQAQLMLTERDRKPFESLDDVRQRVPGLAESSLNNQRHEVRSRFFEARVRLRLEDRITDEWALIQRDQLQVSVRWRRYP